jgi:hypothetical protein
VSDPIPTLLAEADGALRAAGVRAAVIGGCARNAWAEVRPTKDVDFVVEVSEGKYPDLVKSLASIGFRRASAVGGAPGVVPDLELFRDASGRRIDLLYAHTDFERSALTRAEVREPYAGVSLPVCSPEDLVVYKLLAGRPQDLLDIQAMMAALTSGNRPVDWAYVERWADVWEIREPLDRLRASLD